MTSDRTSVSGRVPSSSRVVYNNRSTITTPRLDNDATTYWGNYAAFLTTSRMALDNQFVINLKAAGIFQKLDAAYILAHEVEDLALRNIIKRSHDCSKTGTITFAKNSGFTGNGSTGYLNTNYNPSTQGVNYQTNQALMGIYCRTNLAQNSTTSIGSQLTGGNPRAFQNLRSVAGSWAYSINGSAGGSIAVPSSLGLFVAQRPDSGNLLAYRNGSQIASVSNSANSAPSGNIYIGARDNIGVGADSFSPRQYAAVFLGGLLTAGEHSTLFTLLETYLDVIGAGVI